MRLIDADKLPATCNVAIVNGKVELNGWIAAERITEAPTVKAIPVEWIDNYLSKWKNVETYDVAKTWWLIMKRDWEKENDQTN